MLKGVTLYLHFCESKVINLSIILIRVLNCVVNIFTIVIIIFQWNIRNSEKKSVHLEKASQKKITSSSKILRKKSLL